MILKITNNLTKIEYKLPVTDKGSTMNFYKFEITLPQSVDDGEYTYQLVNEKDEIISNGLLQIGDYVAPNTEYNNTVKYQTFK